MKKIFYFTWLISFLFALFVLLGASFKEAGRIFLYQEYPEGFAAGDLFDFSLLEDFKGKFRLIKGETNGQLETADVITFGDSFFDCDSDSPLFAKELEERLGLPIYNRSTLMHTDVDVDVNPMAFLKSMNYRKGKRRILILEHVERHSMVNIFALDSSPMEDVDKEDEILTFHSLNDWVVKHLIVLNNGNKDFDYYFRRNILTYPLTKWIANFRFKFLGEFDSNIGNYSLSHRMLFYSGDLGFNYAHKSERILDLMATILSEFSQKLKQAYNIDLVYVVIPNKYSIYNDFVRPYFYDNYITQISEKLRAKGVPFIDLYSVYMNYRSTDDSRLLYFPSDTHFTPFGKGLLVEAAIKELKNLGN